MSRFSLGERPFRIALRAWTMKVSTPAAAQASTRVKRLASGSWSSTPIRHFTVAGTDTAPRMAAMQSATRAGSSIRQAPNRPD